MHVFSMFQSYIFFVTKKKKKKEIKYTDRRFPEVDFTYCLGF